MGVGGRSLEYPSNMSIFIAQVDEICVDCKDELPKGSVAYSDGALVHCVDCVKNGEAEARTQNEYDRQRGH